MFLDSRPVSCLRGLSFGISMSLSAFSGIEEILRTIWDLGVLRQQFPRIGTDHRIGETIYLDWQRRDFEWPGSRF